MVLYITKKKCVFTFPSYLEYSRNGLSGRYGQAFNNLDNSET